MMQPIFTTPEIWAGSLVIDFPKDNVPILEDVNNWKPWGNQLAQLNTFASNGCPGADSYNLFFDFADAVFACMNQESF